MAVNGAGRNRYYKKIKATANGNTFYDINPSGVYGDLFEGQNTAAVIKGGAESRFYLSDMVIPDSDSYGEGNLVGLKQYYFPTDITLNDDSYTPLIKLWKLNQPVGESKEGNITVNNRNVTVITANTSLNVPWIYEPFNQGASKVESINSYQTVSSYGEPYISLDDAHLYQNRNLGKVDLAMRYGTKISGQSEVVIFISKKIFIGNKLVPSGDTFSTWTVNALAGTAAAFAGATVIGAGISLALLGSITYDEEWAPSKGQAFDQIDVHFMNVPNSALNYVSSKTSQSNIDETKTETDADITNTIIQNVYKSGDIKVFDDENTRLISSKATMSTDTFLTEGQSLKLRTYWHQNVVGGTEGFQSFDDDWGPWDLEDRQEVKATFEFPFPQSIDTAGDSTLRDSDKPDGQGFLHSDWFTTPAIQMDLNIGNISPLFRVYGDNSAQHENIAAGNARGSQVVSLRQCAWVRGMAITFSRTQPRQKESFYTFMARMTSTQRANEIKGITDADKEVDTYGNATGVIIGKVPIKFGSTTGAFVTPATRNANGVNEMPNYPVVALPINSAEHFHTGDPGSTADGDDQPDEDQEGRFNLTPLYRTHPSETWSFDNVEGKALHWYVHSQLNPIRDSFADQAVVIDESKWLNFKFTIHKGKLYYQIKDSKTGEAISKPMQLVGNKGSPVFQNDQDCPKFITIWNFNFHGRAKYPNLQPQDVSMYNLGHYREGSTGDYGITYEPYPFTTENTLYVDNITLSGFNHTHSNATVNDNNPFKGNITIPNSLTNTATDTASNTGLDTTWPSSTYISLGFDAQEDFDKAASGATHNLWFGGMAASSNIVGIHHDSDDIAIRAGFTTNAKDERIGGQSNQSFFTYATTPGNTGVDSPFANRGLNTTGVALRGLDFSGNTQVDNFSRKGGAILNFKSDEVTFGTQHGGATATAARRENIFASARILDISRAAEGIIGVDSINIFDLPDDTEYVIYTLVQRKDNEGNGLDAVWPGGNGTTAAQRGLVVKLKERPSGGLITVNKDCRFSSHFYYTNNNIPQHTKERVLDAPNDNKGSLLCHEVRKNTLWISPLKYWLTLEVRNTNTTAGEQGVTRSYNTICMVNQGSSLPTTSDFGATFNESLYTDAADYSNAWNLIPSIEDGVAETQKDYGYGIMTEDTPEAGFITSTSLSLDLDAYNKWLVLDASPAIKTDKLTEGEVFSTMLSPSNHINLSSMTIATSENTDKIVDETYGVANTKRPFALAIYEDELPTISDFKVTPNENNPYYADFSWNVDAHDSWYGFIIIDTEIPSHQYHRCSWHVPMWRPLPSSENSFMHWPPSRDDSEGDVLDYCHDDKWQYGFFRGSHDLIQSEHSQPSATTTKGEHTAGTVYDYTTFLDPDFLRIHSPTLTNDFDDEKSFSEEKCSFNLHIRPSRYARTGHFMGIADFGGNGANYSGLRLLLDSDGKVHAFFGSGYNAGASSVGGHIQGAVQLQSHSAAPLDGTPTNIIVTFDKTLGHGNCKLFINGKLEDQSGKVITSGNGTATRWDGSKKLRIDVKTMFGSWRIGYVSLAADKFRGRMEEVVYYPYVIYPVSPLDGKYTWLGCL